MSADASGARVVDVARLARAARELAVDLASARRDCRDKQQRIDSLQAENARLRTAASGGMGSDDPDTEVLRVRDGVRNLGARHREHGHGLDRVSSVVLVLWRGILALKAENASLRLELTHLGEQQTGRDDAASTELLSSRSRRP